MIIDNHRLSAIVGLLVLSLSCSPFPRQDPQPLSEDIASQQMKILIIGNSYSEDAVALLPLIVNASGADVSNVCIYKVIRGSASFRKWVDIYHDRDSLSSYYIDYVLGDFNANVSTGLGIAKDGSKFRRLLSDEQWDLIILNQVSSFATDYDQWTTDGEGGCLNQLLDIIRDHQSHAKIGFLLIHSYAGNSRCSSLERWRLIVDSVKELRRDYAVDLIIPYGTAIQNLRSSSLNDKFDLTRDGSHCGFGLCRYTAACCFYESVIAPICGVSVKGNLARYDASNDHSTNPPISVTDDNAPVAQLAAILAVEHWDRCVNPENEY